MNNSTNDVIINGRKCYLSINNNVFYLNYYNSKAEAYEKLEVNNKDNTFSWLKMFHNPKTTVEFAKVLSDNDTLWNNLNINDDKIDLINSLNNDLKRLNSLNSRNKTNYLAKILRNHGFAICENNNELYRFEQDKGCYIHYNINDYLKFIANEIEPKLDELLVNEVVLRAIKTLKNFKSIYHNIVSFNNGYYDTINCIFKADPFEDGIPYYHFDINYNPEATVGNNFKIFWSNYDNDLQNQIFEFIGYLLLKGNPLKKIFIIVGLTDSGKSTLINIIKHIIKKCSDVPLSAINKGGHELSSLLDSNVNFMNDEEQTNIKNNSIIKKLSGNDDIFINPKNKDPITLKGPDVPKQVVICNNMPKFSNIEDAIKNRLGIIVLNTIKNIPKDKQDNKLEDKIKIETESLEWLVYNSLESVKNLNKPSWDMSFKNNEEFNDIVGKYALPVKYLLEKGFEYTGQETNFDMEYDVKDKEYITSDEMNKFLLKSAKFEKVQIPQLNSKGNVKPKVIDGYINDIFGLKNYKRVPKKVDGKTQRVYYYIVKTQYYYDIINNQNSL